jgi:hypothetical protein
MPSFDVLLANYLKDRVGGNIKRQIGGAIDDTHAAPKDQWLGGDDGDTCTIRMSRTLNYSGVLIPAHFPGLRTASGKDGLHYAFAVQEMRTFLTATFGQPQIESRRPASRKVFALYKGIILFDINFGMNPDGATRAMGHVDLWDGKTFFDEAWGISTPGRDFFTMASRVSLWVAVGTGMIAT